MAKADVDSDDTEDEFYNMENAKPETPKKKRPRKSKSLCFEASYLCINVMELS